MINYTLTDNYNLQWHSTEDDVSSSAAGSGRGGTVPSLNAGVGEKWHVSFGNGLLAEVFVICPGNTYR